MSVKAKYTKFTKKNWRIDMDANVLISLKRYHFVMDKNKAKQKSITVLTLVKFNWEKCL